MGPGVAWPMAIPSRNCSSLSQPCAMASGSSSGMMTKPPPKSSGARLEVDESDRDGLGDGDGEGRQRRGDHREGDGGHREAPPVARGDEGDEPGGEQCDDLPAGYEERDDEGRASERQRERRADGGTAQPPGSKRDEDHDSRADAGEEVVCTRGGAPTEVGPGEDGDGERGGEDEGGPGDERAGDASAAEAEVDRQLGGVGAGHEVRRGRGRARSSRGRASGGVVRTRPPSLRCGRRGRRRRSLRGA